MQVGRLVDVRFSGGRTAKFATKIIRVPLPCGLTSARCTRMKTKMAKANKVGRPKIALEERAEKPVSIPVPVPVDKAFEYIGRLQFGPGNKRNVMRRAFGENLQKLYRDFHDKEHQKLMAGKTGLLEETLGYMKDALIYLGYDVPEIPTAKSAPSGGK